MLDASPICWWWKYDWIQQCNLSALTMHTLLQKHLDAPTWFKMIKSIHPPYEMQRRVNIWWGHHQHLWEQVVYGYGSTNRNDVVRYLRDHWDTFWNVLGGMLSQIVNDLISWQTTHECRRHTLPCYGSNEEVGQDAFTPHKKPKNCILQWWVCIGIHLYPSPIVSLAFDSALSMQLEKWEKWSNL